MAPAALDLDDKHNKQATPTTILAARRWMLSGLIVSVLGTRVLDGAVNGTVALGILPVASIAVYGTIEKTLSILSPLLAYPLQHLSPAKVLVTSDLLESIGSAGALTIILIFPRSVTTVLVAYLLLAAVLPVIGDLAEEFYAQQLAQLGAGHALDFNANVFSFLTLTGMLFAMPLGSLAAARSLTVVFATNTALSLAGFLLRFRSMRTIPTPPLTHQDTDKTPHTRMRLGAVINVLVDSGPASPATSLLLEFSAGLTGTYVLLWGAHSLPFGDAASMAVMLAVFGVGATLGPQAGRYLGKRRPLTELIRHSVLASICLLLAMAALARASPAPSHLAAIGAAVFAFAAPVLSRARYVLITTLRQTAYHGRRFTLVMSWAFSLDSIGNLAGLWAGLLLNVTQNPIWGLLTAAATLTPVLAAPRRPIQKAPQ